MKIRDKDIFHFGLDYLEVKGTSRNIEWIQLWLDTNKDWYSTAKNFNWYLGKRVNKVMNYEYKTILQRDWIDCFAYHKWMQQWEINTHDYIAVYGSAFQVFKNPKDIIDFVLDNIEYEEIKRFDIAIDILKDTKSIYKNFVTNKGKWSVFLDDKWEVQTFYIWEKKKKYNRRKLVRCYNKIDDIKRNKKRHVLYTEYLIHKDITRVEIEFRSELCSNIDLIELLEIKFLYDIFFSYIKKHTEIFSKIWFNPYVLKSTKKRISIDELKTDELFKNRYINIFVWYAKSILEIWWCPIDILIRKWHISEDTKKDIVLSIKDGVFRQDIYEFWLGVRNSKYIFRDPDDTVTYLSQDDYYE